jgi:uridine kinase
MKNGICGKMCSGKTTLANYILSKNPNYKKFSFADKLKEIAKDLFFMEKKNRNLLINIGTKMREIVIKKNIIIL